MTTMAQPRLGYGFPDVQSKKAYCVPYTTSEAFLYIQALNNLQDFPAWLAKEKKNKKKKEKQGPRTWGVDRLVTSL
jgi:hypothetical protein